ncbi:MAG: hypothetical protein D6722_25045 [Bacteroidetes bacterium]|nr:MAG: hypothetical protein D6722_25045 [Bacteroidota bacterium]
MTKAEVERLFTDIPPNAETAPKYARIKAAEHKLKLQLTEILRGTGPDLLARTTESTRAFAYVLVEESPSSPDLSAAIRCVRLARELVNEGVATGHLHEVTEPAFLQVTLARMQACAAIALASGEDIQ